MFEEKCEVLGNEAIEQLVDSDLNQVEQALEVEDASLEVCENKDEPATSEITEISDLNEINLGYDETAEVEAEQAEIFVPQEDNKIQGYAKLRGKTIEELESFYNSICCDRKVGVYVKTNSQGYIIDVVSDIFAKNLDGYIKIDEGDGDKYIHAQTCYFEEPLSDESGHYRYKL